MASEKLIYLLLCFIAQLHFCLTVSGLQSSVDSVPSLERSMYRVIDGYPCVRLLNLSGEIGCANPGREKVAAPIVRFGKSGNLIQTSAILVSLDEVETFFDRLHSTLYIALEFLVSLVPHSLGHEMRFLPKTIAPDLSLHASRVARDPLFASFVGGLLVEEGSDIQEQGKGFSPAEKFPQAMFAAYGNTKYEWNPHGSGIMLNKYDFPVFLLSKNSTSTLKKVVAMTGSKEAYGVNVAEFHLVMQTTKAGTRDSESCLRERTCLPLGGYSVWSSLPPINMSSTVASKNIILVTATMDSASFFRDKSLGAESPMSGLIALLAAVDALSRLGDFRGFKKQLVFLVLTGEAWGYLGSRRFLHEIDLQSDAVKGLNRTLIDMILEIGSVGKGYSSGVKTFFAHSTRASSAMSETVSALQHAQVSLKSEGIQISVANTSNPGIPPSSLMTFLRKNPQASGIVLEDFDSVFANKFYHSHLDTISNINSTSIVAAASLVARSLFILANEGKNSSSLDLSAVSVNASLVDELVVCLLDCNPGLSCGLVKNYISPSNTCPSNYVGVMLGDPSSAPYPGYSSDISRFVWNFLADKTSIKKENASSNCQQGCDNSEELCIRAETYGKGVCVSSSTRYVPAYSTRLKFESGSWSVLPPNSSDPMSMVDPVWSESNWDVTGLRIYIRQDAVYDHLILLGGMAVTVSSYIAIVVVKAFIAKTMKRD